MACFAADEWQVLWPVQQLRFELDQACEKLHVVTGYLYSEKNYTHSAYLQAELERLQAKDQEQMKDLLK